MGILGCGKLTEPKQNEDFMGNVEGSSKTTAKVKFKVVDKNGNIKQEGVAEGELVGKSERKIKRG